MTGTIRRLSRPRDAIFISAGDRETFASFAVEQLSDRFDVFVSYYGQDDAHAQALIPRSVLFQRERTTKFKALKRMWRREREAFDGYRSVWVCDDDLVLTVGDPATLPATLAEFRLDVVAPSFAPDGKNSHAITVHVPGGHRLRMTNFTEMGSPMFSADALTRYMAVFDESLDGWGNDWWFLNVLGADDAPRVGIVDGVVMFNPHDAQKPGGRGEIESVVCTDTRRAQWHATRDRLGLSEWPHRNLYIVHPVNKTVAATRPAAAQPELAASLAPHLDTGHAPRVLALGAGDAVLDLTRLVAARRGRVVCIEHDEARGQHLRAALRQQGLGDTAEVRHAPLQAVTTFGVDGMFYDMSALGADEVFDLAVVDGPPRHACALPRLPALPALSQHLAPGEFKVFLPDCDQDDDRRAVEVWRTVAPELAVRTLPGRRPLCMVSAA